MGFPLRRTLHARAHYRGAGEAAKTTTGVVALVDWSEQLEHPWQFPDARALAADSVLAVAFDPHVDHQRLRDGLGEVRGSMVVGPRIAVVVRALPVAIEFQ